MRVDRWLWFVAGGVVNTGATYAIYLGLSLMMNYQWAYLIAYALGILIAYGINSLLVFKVPVSTKRFVTYPLVYVIQYGIAALLLALCVEYVGLSQTVAPLLVTVVMIPLSYGINKVALSR